MFKLDSAFVRFLNLIADIFILHVLWFIHSIPIITIGASTTALYYSMMKRIDNDRGSIFSNFRSSFKLNFKQSTILWLIEIVAIIVLVIDFRFCLLLTSNARNIFMTLYMVVLIPVCFILIYLFPIQSKFENNIKTTIKNAFIMSILNLHYTIVLFLIPVVFLVICFFFPPFITILFIMGFGIYAYISSLLFTKIFKKYITE